MTERPAEDIHDGWIYVEHPAAEPGWHHVTRAMHSGGWSEFACGREVPYVVNSNVQLRWSKNRPADTNDQGERP